MSTRITQRKVREVKPGNAAVLHDVQRRTDDDGRNPIRFEMTRHQAHRLVTDGTKRTKDRSIGFIFPNTGQDFRSVLGYRLSLTVFRRHTVKARR